jgi:hypothetical protein
MFSFKGTSRRKTSLKAKVAKLERRLNVKKEKESLRRKMESLKNDLLHRSYKSRNLIEAAGEHEYERKWWEEAKVQLENNFIKR